MLQSNPPTTRKLLVYSGLDEISADKLYDIMKADLAPEGSNHCVVQEEVYFHWINLMQEIEGEKI